MVIKRGGFYWGGWAQSLQTGAYQIDIGLWKLNFDGSTGWTRALGKPGSAEHQDGHFVVDDSFIYAAGLWNGGGLANLYNGHSFLGKFSRKDGKLIDSTLFGDQSPAFLDIENALGMVSDGTYLYITGYGTPVTANDWQVFTAKFDKDLNQLWYTTWGGDGTETARGIAVNKGIVYVAGLTQSQQHSKGGKADGLLLQYDTAGKLLSYQTWGDTLEDSFRDIVINEDGIYLSGTSENTNPGGKKTAFLLKMNQPVSNPRLIRSFKVRESVVAGKGVEGGVALGCSGS